MHTHLLLFFPAVHVVTLLVTLMLVQKPLGNKQKEKLSVEKEKKRNANQIP